METSVRLWSYIPPLGGMPLNELQCSEFLSAAPFFGGNSIWPEQASVGEFWLPLWAPNQTHFYVSFLV